MTVTLPTFVREMKTAVETELNFSVLGNGGEARLFAWARENGLRGPVLVTTWQRNYNLAHGEGARPAPPKTARPARIETNFLAHDLDYWADDDQPVDDDDEDDDSDAIPCPVCNGTGKDAMGNMCEKLRRDRQDSRRRGRG